MSVDIKKWWMFEVDDTKIKEFAELMHESGEVTDWTIVLSKVFLCYAAVRELPIGEMSASEIIADLKQRKYYYSGYVRYMNMAFRDIKKELDNIQQHYHADMSWREVSQILFGDDQINDLPAWVIEHLYCSTMIYIGNSTRGRIEETIRRHILNYDKSGAFMYNFMKQITIAITSGIEVLDCLCEGEKVDSIEAISQTPLRFRCNIKSDGKIPRIAYTVKLDNKSIKLLTVYRDSLPEDIRYTMTSSELVNMFIKEKCCMKV